MAEKTELGDEAAQLLLREGLLQKKHKLGANDYDDAEAIGHPQAQNSRGRKDVAFSVVTSILALIAFLALTGIIGDFAQKNSLSAHQPNHQETPAESIDQSQLLDDLVETTGLASNKPQQIETVASVVTQAPEARKPDDYVLDPSWNFDEASQKREYDWEITDAEINPDGVYRPMMFINGQFPGPLIECNEGDTIIVHVRNRAENATALHWHGIYQNGTNHMDGTVGITQCPIAPGMDLTYEFTVTGQHGSYWYHGHVGLQASDGLLGPLVIHSREEKTLQKVDYSTDRVIMVQDYYHDLSGALLPQYLDQDRENEEPVPDGALINGMNIRDCSTVREDRTCDNSSVIRAVFDLERGQKHRLRFINVGAFAEFQIQLDEHEFAVTEVDGTDIEPQHYHRLNIAPAQRYSIVIDGDKSEAETYWLRARMLRHCFRSKNPYMQEEIRGIIRWHDPEVNLEYEPPLPTSLDWSEAVEVVCKDMNTTELVPAQVVTAPATADAFFYLRLNFIIGWWNLDRAYFNGSSWRANPFSPSLIRAVDGLAVANETFSIASTVAVNDVAFNLERELVIQTEGVQTIDIVIQSFDDGAHPIHLHGYKYFVLASGHGHFSHDTYNILDLSNPLRRDTATVEAYGWLLLRIVADNAGLWALHCHNSWHVEAGLMMQLMVRTEVMQTWTLPDEHRALCNAEGLEKGMAPADEFFMRPKDDEDAG